MGSYRSPIDLSTSEPVYDGVGGAEGKFTYGLTIASSEALNEIAEQALRFTGGDGAAIALKENGVFVCKASRGASAPPVGTTVDKESGLSGLCVRTGSVLTCDDTETDSRVSAEACRSLGIRSIVVVPIGEGAPVGLLEVFSCQPCVFDGRSVSLLSRLAHLVVDSAGAKMGVQGEREPVREIPIDEPRKRQGVLRGFAVAGATVAVLLLLAGVISRERLFMPPPPGPAVPSGPSIPEAPLAENDEPSVNNASGPPMQVEPASARGGAPVASTAPNLPGKGDEQYRLATALADGRGVEQDLVRAYALYVIAGLNGNAASDAAIKALTPRMSESSISEVRFRLGQMFENGDHVRRDFVSAYFWFSVAEAAGHPRASEEKRRLENLMSSVDVRDARDRAARWLRQHSRG